MNIKQIRGLSDSDLFAAQRLNEKFYQRGNVQARALLVKIDRVVAERFAV